MLQMEIISKDAVCNVCNLLQNKCEKVDRILVKTFQALLLELSSVVTRNLVVCQECINDATQSLKFKYSIVNAQIGVVSIACMKDNVKTNITQIYKEFRLNHNIVEQDLNILCTFCLSFISADKAVALDPSIKVKILKGFPEVDIGMIETPTICIDCWNSLKVYIKCATNLLQMKKKATYLQGGYGHYSLNNLPFKDPIGRGNKLGEGIKQEPNFKQSLINVTQVLSNQEDTNETVHDEPKNQDEYECHLCTYKSDKKSLFCQHMIVHKEVTDVYRCARCPFETKHQRSISRHNKFIHGRIPRIFECSICSYKFKKKETLKQHMAIHQELAEVHMYECDKCTFKTKRKGTLKDHMIVHQTVAEIALYECEKCSFKTKRKGNLTKHMLVHRDAAEIAMFQCDECSFETKRKGILKDHKLVHREAAEIVMYECDKCSFKTKRKNHLNSHMLVHRDVADVAMYKCEKCPFTTKRKGTIKTHMIVHREFADIAMYKCDECSFMTKRKGNLKTHMIVHQEFSKFSVYRCDKCSFSTRRIDTFKRHNNTTGH